MNRTLVNKIHNILRNWFRNTVDIDLIRRCNTETEQALSDVLKNAKTIVTTLDDISDDTSTIKNETQDLNRKSSPFHVHCNGTIQDHARTKSKDESKDESSTKFPKWLSWAGGGVGVFITFIYSVLDASGLVKNHSLLMMHSRVNIGFVKRYCDDLKIEQNILISALKTKIQSQISNSGYVILNGKSKDISYLMNLYIGD